MPGRRPLDGVALVLRRHGRRGPGRPRGRLSGSGPGVVGDAMPVAVTYDLHGNLTPEKVAGSPLLFAYRTNPHRDHARVRRARRAGAARRAGRQDPPGRGVAQPAHGARRGLPSDFLPHHAAPVSPHEEAGA
ncbi:MAG: M81 family metallopeptidase [bacterium]